MAIPIELTDRERHRIGLLAIALLAILSTFPLFTASVPYAHDLLFHLARIRSIADGLGSGTIPVRLMDAQASGFGYPSGICYPDLLLYLPGLLVMLGCDLWVAYVLFVLLINAATAAIALHSFSRVFRSWRIGLGCCVLWTLSPYRLCDALLRASVGEYLALMFVPLLVLGLWRLFLDDRSAPGAGWLTLALGATGVVLSHVLSVILFMPPCLLALIPLVLWRRKDGWLIGIGKAAGLSVLLCVGFLLPFFDYYTSHDLAVKYFSNSCAKHALEPAQLFGAFWELSGESLELGRSLVREMPLGAGWCLMFMLPMAALVMLVPSVRTERYDGLRRWIMLFGIATLAILFLTTCWFPWDLDVPVLGSMVGALATIQFPWRLVGVATLLLVLLAGTLASCITPKVQLALAASVALCLAECGIATNTYLRWAPRKTLEGYMQIDPAIGMGEYLPIELSLDIAKEWQRGSYPTSQGDGTLESCERITPQSWRTSVANDTNETQVVRLPALWHHQLEIVPEDGSTDAEVVYDGGYAGIKLTPGQRGTYRMNFVEPASWRIAEAVSGVTAVAVIGVSVVGARRKRA